MNPFKSLSAATAFDAALNTALVGALVATLVATLVAAGSRPALAQEEELPQRLPESGLAIVDCAPPSPAPENSCIVRVPSDQRLGDLASRSLGDEEAAFRIVRREADLPAGLSMSATLVLLDLSKGPGNGRVGSWAAERAQIERVIASLPRDGALAIYGFGADLQQITPFSRDRDRALSALRDTELTQNNTILASNITGAMELLETRDDALLKNLIIISDGDEEGIRNLDEITDQAAQSGITLSALCMFWVPEDSVTNWNQTIVATLEGSENVGRLMFFNDIDPIFDVIESENPGVPAAALREEAEAAEAGGAASDTVVALGPRAVIDQRENLYVMPILEFEEAIFDSGSFVNLLRIAVARAQPEGRAPDAPAPRRDATPEQFRAGVVFVVDTTISMEPYIRATQAALEEVYREIEGANVSNAVSFGLIGYRDSLQAAPALGYATRTFVTLQEGTNPQNFLTGIAQMDEAGSTSRNFREDSYAGIEHALTQLDWSGFDARFIVLVSDAGPREAGDEFSQTGLSGEGLNRVVRERIDGAIVVMHLKTPGGASDHAKAEAAYRELARYPNQPPFYFPIENGDPEEFRRNARGLGRLISQQVVNFRGKAAPEGGDAITSEDDPVARRFAGVMSAGRTMQLAFLGQTQGARAPDVFEAWVADRDFDRPGLKPLSIRVLISKRDLSNLQEALRIIIEEGEKSVIDPDQFFSQVLGAAADMSRRPDQVSRQADPSLAQAVAIDEYIEDLPYRSRIMSITEREWLDQSFAEQQSIINELYDKIERYARYNEATDQWVDYLGTGAQAENLLYPMPLDDLP